ncbi:MAG: hypothetical protein JXA37_08170 [Chloroflexia bacterium]|nr:hypothetical protein [Chloroflexia bacterium]
MVLAESEKVMQDLFAPIESPEEALIYAQLLSGLQSRDTFLYNKDLTYFQAVIQTTQVRETSEGYIVNLFHSEVCGCNTYITSQVDLLVSYGGSLAWLAAQPIYVRYQAGCVD